MRARLTDAVKAVKTFVIGDVDQSFLEAFKKGYKDAEDAKKTLSGVSVHRMTSMDLFRPTTYIACISPRGSLKTIQKQLETILALDKQKDGRLPLQGLKNYFGNEFLPSSTASSARWHRTMLRTALNHDAFFELTLKNVDQLIASEEKDITRRVIEKHIQIIFAQGLLGIAELPASWDDYTKLVNSEALAPSQIALTNPPKSTTTQGKKLHHEIVADFKSNQLAQYDSTSLVKKYLTVQASDEKLAQKDYMTMLPGLMLAADGTVTVLNTCFRELAKQPLLQAELRQELDQVFGKAGALSRLDLQDEKECPFLHAVLKEALRFEPPAQAIRRYTKHGIKNDVLDIPPNTIIEFSIRNMLQSREYFVNPEKFNPSRFLRSLPQAYPESFFRLHSVPLIPFSIGERRCPATSLAPLVLATYIAQIVWNNELIIKGDGICLQKIDKNKKVVSSVADAAATLSPPSATASATKALLP